MSSLPHSAENPCSTIRKREAVLSQCADFSVGFLKSDSTAQGSCLTSSLCLLIVETEALEP